MTHSYEIVPRPADLGGGWQLRLLEGGQEVGGGVFPPVVSAADSLQAAYDAAEGEAYAWLDSREG